MRKILITLFLLPILALASPNTIVYNVTNDTVVQGSLDSQEVSIASISKLMTVYTVLKHGQDLDEKLTVRSQRTPNTKLSKGMTLTRRELIDLALISSDNIAAITLAENFPGGHSQFVFNMNLNARELGMTNTGFVEPTGLSPMNYSTLHDIIWLTKAVSEYKIVQDAAQTQKTVATPTKKVNDKKKKKQKVQQNKIVANPTIKYFGKEGVITVKTGFTRAAGFCITMLVRSNDKLYNITVLGARTKQERQQLVEKSLATIYNA